MKGIVLRYGLLSGTIVSLIMATSMIYFHKFNEGIDFSWSMIIGYSSMVIAFSMIFVAIRAFRDNINSGIISFGKALLIAFLVVLISSTMYVVTWAIVYKTVMPDFMEKYTSSMLEELKKTVSETEWKMKEKEMEEFKNMYNKPFYFAMMTYSEIIPVGLIIAFIAAGIMKRRNVTT